MAGLQIQPNEGFLCTNFKYYHCSFSPFPYPNMKRLWTSLYVDGKADAVLVWFAFGGIKSVAPDGAIAVCQAIPTSIIGDNTNSTMHSHFGNSFQRPSRINRSGERVSQQNKERITNLMSQLRSDCKSDRTGDDNITLLAYPLGLMVCNGNLLGSDNLLSKHPNTEEA